jgi:hypothetical protein
MLVVLIVLWQKSQILNWQQVFQKPKTDLYHHCFIGIGDYCRSTGTAGHRKKLCQ